MPILALNILARILWADVITLCDGITSNLNAVEGSQRVVVD